MLFRREKQGERRELLRDSAFGIVEKWKNVQWLIARDPLNDNRNWQCRIV